MIVLKIRNCFANCQTGASLRWNREVTQTLETTNTYPTFCQFVDFITKEARVACNPISSIYALNSTEQKSLRETKTSNASNKVKVLATNTSNHAKTSNDTDTSKVCAYCGKDRHPIFKCERFLLLLIDEKRDCIHNKRLCFGCLKRGHVNKECK